MRIFKDSHRLHSRQIVNNGQTMEAERTVREMMDGFQSEGVGSPVSDLMSSVTLNGDIVITSEYSPNTTHLVCELISILEILIPEII
jgi:hypothetical protein